MPCTTDEKFRLLGGEGCGGEGDSERGQRKGYHGGEGVGSRVSDQGQRKEYRVLHR